MSDHRTDARSLWCSIFDVIYSSPPPQDRYSTLPYASGGNQMRPSRLASLASSSDSSDHIEQLGRLGFVAFQSGHLIQQLVEYNECAETSEATAIQCQDSHKV